MAQPPPYKPKTNFSTTAITGSRLATEFTAIKATLDAALANLSAIQNDEGFIRQDAVLPGAFNRAATALSLTRSFRPRGQWTLGFTYRVNDIVINQGAVYFCLIEHSSLLAALNNSFTDALNAGYWMYLPMNGRGLLETKYTASEGDASISHTYVVGAIMVFVNGIKLDIGTDAIASTGTAVTFPDPLHEGDIVEIVEFDDVAVNQLSTVPALSFGTVQTLGAAAKVTFGAMKIRDLTGAGITMKFRSVMLATLDGAYNDSTARINVYRDTGSGFVAMVTADANVTGKLPWPSIRADKTGGEYVVVTGLGDNDKIKFELENLTAGSLDLSAAVSVTLEDDA